MTEHTPFAHLAADRAPDAILVTDEACRVQWANAAFCDMTGHDMETLTGAAPDTVLYASADPEARDAVIRALRGLEAFDTEILTQRSDGGAFWTHVRMRPLHDGEGVIIGMISSHHDISDQRRCMAEHERVLAQLNDMEMTAGLGCWELDLSERRVRWSQGAYRLHDRIAEGPSVALDDALDHFPGAARRTMIEALERLWADAKPFSLELPLVTAEERQLWVVVTGRVSFHPRTGAPERLFGIIQDITARRDYERDVMEAREDASRKDRAKTAFLANMNHELRTPLNGLLGMLQVMQDQAPDGADSGPLTMAYECAESLRAIIEDVLHLAELEAGAFDIREADFDPGVIAREVTALFISQAREKGLLIDLDVDPATPRLMHGDGGRVRQVLTHLVSNAVKFTDKGRVSVAISAPQGSLRCVVTDTGPGVAQELRPLMFQKFIKSDLVHHTQSGAGVGLAISRILVERMGGRIGFNSEFGQGSQFWFEVQVQSAASGERRGAPNEGGSPSQAAE